MVLLLLAVTVLLALKWILTAIICKKKPDFSIMKQKTFWLCTVILAAVITVIIILTYAFLSFQNPRKDFTEVGYSVGYRDSGTEYEGLYFDIDADEQHSWNVIDKNPTFTVKWVNRTEKNINYSTKCYIYKQTNNGWGLCSSDYIDFAEDIFTIPATSVKTHVYSIAGYKIAESGRYRFVTFVDKKAVWVEFDVTIND